MLDKAAVQGLDSCDVVTDQFAYTVTDGTATSNTSTLTITVFGNNDAPVAVADTNWAQEDLHACMLAPAPRTHGSTCICRAPVGFRSIPPTRFSEART